MEATALLQSVAPAALGDFKAWLDAVPVLVAIFGAALILDVEAVGKMFFSRELYLWFNWLVSAVFLLSFLTLTSIRYESFEELWAQSSTLIVLVSSFGYLIMFFAAVVAHDRLQTALGKPPTASSLASLFFGIVFACGCLAWRILVPTSIGKAPGLVSVTLSSFSSSSSSSDGAACNASGPGAGSASATATGAAAAAAAAANVSSIAANATSCAASHSLAQATSPTVVLAMLFGLALLIAGIIFVRWASADGYDSAKNRRSKEFRQMRSKSYPGTYPNGWYRVAESVDVPVGKVIEVSALGKVFAVFRGEDGKVGILDAYCIHLGANLTVRGKVVGSCLECPFHKWRFDVNGKCTHIPYSEKIPEVANTRAWPCREYYGSICIYYDADGNLDPPYELDPFPQIDSGQFVYRGSHAEWVDMHIQEFAENAVDFQHFDPLHGQMHLPWTNVKIPGIRIKHVADWKADDTPGREHVSYFFDRAELIIFGKLMPSTGASAKTTMMGPASIVSFQFTIPDVGEIILFQTHMPVEPCRCKVSFLWYADKKIPRLLVWYVVGNWIAQWRNDISVWENKVYVSKPVLVKGDGPVSRLRRWYLQFYSPANQHENDAMSAGRCGGGGLDW